MQENPMRIRYFEKRACGTCPCWRRERIGEDLADVGSSVIMPLVSNSDVEYPQRRRGGEMRDRERNPPPARPVVNPAYLLVLRKSI